jgi:hypothetical protein
VPVVGWEPLQSPLAIQVLALVVLQLSTVDCPELSVAGEAVRVTVGGGGAVTITVAEALALPPSPLQVIVYV